LIVAQDVLLNVHQDYVRVGAEIITTNTFRTHRRSLAKAGMGDRARELTFKAVEIAKLSGAAFVAGSIATLEDCYSPELVPSQDECEAEHAELAQNLADAGVDLILVETMNCIREAIAATQAALNTGLPVLTSFVCRSDGRLFSGETVAAAVQAISPLGVSGLLINCTTSSSINQPYIELRENAPRSMRTGLYANIGHVDETKGWTNTQDISPEGYAALAQDWLKLGANLIGGCCGTSPEYIVELAKVINSL
jgi:S-methylmethionine-dependent homocysteine/selenocysteine methylase